MGYTVTEYVLDDEERIKIYSASIVVLGKLFTERRIKNSHPKYVNELSLENSCIEKIRLKQMADLLIVGMFFIKKMWPILHLGYQVTLNKNYVKNYSDVKELKKHLKRHYKIWFGISKSKGEFKIYWRSPLRGQRILEKTKLHALRSVHQEIISHVLETFDIMGLIIEFFQPEVIEKLKEE